MKGAKKSFTPWTLAIAWVLVQATLFAVQGVHTDLEATKYTDQAANLLSHGHYSAPKYFFYSTLIFVIAGLTKIGAGYGGVVLFQILMNGLATACLFKLTSIVTGRERPAYLATLLFIFFFPVQTWNTYLYTESLFISLSILFFYMLSRYPPLNVRNLLAGSLFIFLLTITRPFGVLYIVPFLIYAFLLSPRQLRIGLSAMSLVGIVLFFVLVNFAFRGGEDMDAMKPFKEEHIICFMPSTQPAKLNLSEWGSPVAQMFYYIAHNPAHFAGLMSKRILSFFWLPKSYFSSLHNLYLALTIIPLYIAALLALWKGRVQHVFQKFIVLLLIIYTLGMTFQCNDYHNRFAMPLFPLILLLAACGLDHSLSRIGPIKKRRD